MARTIELMIFRDRPGFDQDTIINLPETEMTAENLAPVAGPIQQLQDSFEADSAAGTKYTVRAVVRDTNGETGHVRVELLLVAVNKADFDWFDQLQAEIAAIVNPPNPE